MNIAFIHYHLNKGGVTTVIRRQAEIVRQYGEVLILSGCKTSPVFPFEVVYLPGLSYDGQMLTSHSPAHVADDLCDAIYGKWPDGCDVIHVHNATLTKNKNILLILNELRNRDMRLFIQIHDFAEDGRPTVYSSDDYVADCHYGVVNSRDYNLLLSAGLNESGLHYLPNPCRTVDPSNNRQNAQHYALYPVRAIRRKNPGEAILISLFLESNQTLAITQPPDEPVEMACYNDWKTFVEYFDLQVDFEAGLNQNINDLISRSEFILTTSISEGFGLFFVDAWSAGKLLWGRYLPHVCRDFEKNDISLDHLYRDLKIPAEWIDLRAFHHKWASSVKAAFRRFDRQADEPLLTRLFKRTLLNGTIDFGLLDEHAQKQIITTCKTDSNYKNHLMRLNPVLTHPGYVHSKDILVAKNQKSTINKYNLDIYEKKLMKAYKNICKFPIRHRIDRDKLLDGFLHAEKFSLLKWARYEG